MVFSDGSEYLHDFKVNVPAPVLAGIKSEYAPDGGTIELTGDFFFDPKVIFPGEIVGEIVSSDKNKIIVTVPSGVEPGFIVVSTNFGKATSKFIFRDDRNTILNFDDKPHVNWTAPTFGVENNGVVPVSGNYAMFSDGDFGFYLFVLQKLCCHFHYSFYKTVDERHSQNPKNGTILCLVQSWNDVFRADSWFFYGFCLQSRHSCFG